MATAGQAALPLQARKGDWEWLWRFLAAVLLFSVSWVAWVAVHLSSAPLATPAAFEAAAQAGASRNVQGDIKPKPPAAEAKEPPVNMAKLRLAESIGTPIPESQ